MTSAQTFIQSPFFADIAGKLKIIMNQSYNGKEKSGALLLGKQIKTKMMISPYNVIMLTQEIENAKSICS